MNDGIAIALLGGSEPEPQLIETARRAASATPSGRICAFVWKAPPPFTKSLPTEAILTRAILGPACDRGESKTHDPWLFYANVTARHYERAGGALPFAFATYALLFRRQGAPPYERIKDGSMPPQEDRLQTLHPAFTRDIANNTWTLPADNGPIRVAARIAVLLSWSDERIVFFNEGTRSRRHLRSFHLSSELLGVPTKVPYEWGQHRSGPGQTALSLT